MIVLLLSFPRGLEWRQLLDGLQESRRLTFVVDQFRRSSHILKQAEEKTQKVQPAPSRKSPSTLPVF